LALVSLDMSLLATPVRSSASGSVRAPAAYTSKKLALPPQLDGVLASRLTDVRARKTLVDEKAFEVTRAGEDRDLKTAFTLYRALDALKTLSEAAASKATSAAERTKLNDRFRAGLAELQAYLAKASTDKLTLQFGAKASKVDATLPPKEAGIYTGLPVVSGTTGVALADVASTDGFDISLTKGLRQDTIRINFLEISGPITLRAVVDLANSKISSIAETDSNGAPLLDANGNPVKRYASQFSLVRTNDLKTTPATFGLSITPAPTEKLALQDVSAGPSAYLIHGVTADKGPTTASFRRVDNITGTTSASAATAIAAKETAATALAKTVYEATKTKTSRAPAETAAATSVAASAVDSQGFVYVVGTTRGAMHGQADTAADDIFLTKYDSNGVAVFARKLGAAGAAQGAAITIDSNDNVIIAGSFSGKMSGDLHTGQDTLVMKFDSAGREKFSVQLDSVAADQATSIVVDAADNIYVAGTVSGSLTGQTSAGGQDIFVAKLDAATGAVAARTQLGTTGRDSVAALSIAPDGTLLLAGTENDQAVLRQFAGADLTQASTQISFGALSGGAVTSLAVDRVTGDIAVGGYTRASLTGDALAGDADSFVARLSATYALNGISQFGTAAADRITGLQSIGGKIYASGTTAGDLVHARSGPTDAFLARLDAATGDVEHMAQFGVPLRAASQALIAISETGPGTLAKLGLRQGDVRPQLATTLVDRTTLRKDDQFIISVNGRAQTVTIRADDDARSLVKRLKAIVGRFGDVTLTENTSGTKIALRATGDARLDLQAGPAGKDALAKLGLPPGQLRSANVLFDTGKDPVEVARTPGGSFGLDLSDALALTDEKTSGVVKAKIETALETMKRAYRSLYYDPAREELARRRTSAGAVPAYLSAQLGNYQDALNRLAGGGSGVTT
jgi:trimeric autotransporter adhesin